MGFRTRALVGACIFSISVFTSISSAQDAVSEETNNQESVGPQKEIPPQPSKGELNVKPIPVKGQPQVARLKLDPNTNDAINEAVSGDINPIILEYSKYAASAKIESRKSDIPMRGLISSSELLAARNGNINMNRRALMLMRRSATMRPNHRPVAAGHSSTANVRFGSRVVAPQKELTKSFQISNSASPTTASPPPMLAAVPMAELEVEPASGIATGNDTLELKSAPAFETAQPVAINATSETPKQGAVAEKPVAPASMHIARDAAKPVAIAQAPAPTIDKWERYFLDVSKYYQFNEQQHAAGERILESIRTRASQYRLSREKQFESSAKLTDKTEREARLGGLNKPIENMFHELKVRLENLATLNQRHSVTGPEPK